MPIESDWQRPLSATTEIVKTEFSYSLIDRSEDGRIVVNVTTLIDGQPRLVARLVITLILSETTLRHAVQYLLFDGSKSVDAADDDRSSSEWVELPGVLDLDSFFTVAGIGRSPASPARRKPSPNP